MYPIAVDGTLGGFTWNGDALVVTMDGSGDEHVIAAPLRGGGGLVRQIR
jgi:hypothetical protein